MNGVARLIVCVAMVGGSPAAAAAEEVVLNVGAPLANARLLTPGTQRYVRYIIKDGRRSAADIWSRTISFETTGGKRLVKITQRWDTVGDPTAGQRQESLFEAGTMRPITHLRWVSKAGKTQHTAYRFDGASVTGLADAADNEAKDFAIRGDEPLYNFVTDIEWFRQLPMRAGRSFIASLYDPPFGKPARYTFKIVGSDTIKGPGGEPLDCWLMTADYNQPDKPLSRYWFAKRTQMMVRQESVLGERGILVKSLLASEAGDSAAPS